MQKFPNNLILKSGCANTVDQCMQKFPNNLMTIDNCEMRDGLLQIYSGVNCEDIQGQSNCNISYSAIQDSGLAYQCVWASENRCKSYNNSPIEATICRIPTD